MRKAIHKNVTAGEGSTFFGSFISAIDFSLILLTLLNYSMYTESPCTLKYCLVNTMHCFEMYSLK